MYNGNNVNDVIDKWMNIFLSMATKYIPYYEITVRPGDKDFVNILHNLQGVKVKVTSVHKLMRGSSVISDPSVLAFLASREVGGGGGGGLDHCC